MQDLLLAVGATSAIFAPIIVWMQRRIDRLERVLAKMQDRLLDCEKGRALIEARAVLEADALKARAVLEATAEARRPAVT